MKNRDSFLTITWMIVSTLLYIGIIFFISYKDLYLGLLVIYAVLVLFYCIGCFAPEMNIPFVFGLWNESYRNTFFEITSIERYFKQKLFATLYFYFVIINTVLALILSMNTLKAHGILSTDFISALFENYIFSIVFSLPIPVFIILSLIKIEWINTTIRIFIVFIVMITVSILPYIDGLIMLFKDSINNLLLFSLCNITGFIILMFAVVLLKKSQSK